MVTGDNILTAISVGRDCELVKPDQTIIRVEAELVPDSYSPRLNVSYSLEENEKSNIVHDVSICSHRSEGKKGKKLFKLNSLIHVTTVCSVLPNTAFVHQWRCSAAI